MAVSLTHLKALFLPGRVIESVDIPVKDYFKWILGLGYKNFVPYTSPDLIRMGQMGEVSFKYTTFQLRVYYGLEPGILVVHRDMNEDPQTYITSYPEDFFDPQPAKAAPPLVAASPNLSSLLGKSARHVGGIAPAVTDSTSTPDPPVLSPPTGPRLFLGVEAGKVKSSKVKMFYYETVKHQGSAYTGMTVHTYIKGVAPPPFHILSKRAEFVAPVFQEDFPGQEPLLLLV